LLIFRAMMDVSNLYIVFWETGYRAIGSIWIFWF